MPLAAFKDETRHGTHLPDHGTPVVPKALLDGVRPTRAAANTENAVPEKPARTLKNAYWKIVLKSGAGFCAGRMSGCPKRR